MPSSQPAGAFTTLGTGLSNDSIFSPDGSLLYAVSGNTVTVYRTSDGTAAASYSFGTSLGRIDISANGASLAVIENNPASGAGTIYRLSLTTGAVETFAFAGTARFYDLAYLADGRLIVTQANAGPLRMIDLASSAITTIGTIAENASVSISADNGYAIALPQTITGPIHSFDLDTGIARALVTVPDPYAGASLPPYSRGIGAASPDGSLVYFAGTGRVYTSDLRVYGAVTAAHSGSGAVFSPDGTRLYLVSEYSDRLSVVDVATLQQIASYDLRANVTGTIELRVSDNGTLLSITSANGVQVINLALAIQDQQPSSGNDTLYGNFNSERISGLAGSDTIYGDDGDDYLASLSFDALASVSFDAFSEHDSLYGGNGNDCLFAGYGDTVDGGASLYEGDTIYLNLLGAPSGVNVDFRQLVIELGGGTISGVENVGWVQGTNFADTINVGSNPNTVSGYTVVLGLAGDDLLIGGRYTSLLDGGVGNDILDGRLGGSSLIGGPGNDTIYAGTESSALTYGGDGDDLIYANGDSWGGAGNDVIHAGATNGFSGHSGEVGNDIIYGSSGDNRLWGGSGADTLFGGAGNDIIGSAEAQSSQWPQFDLGLERDIIDAGAGNDVVSAGFGDDADGGDGTDSLIYSFGGLNGGAVFDTGALTEGSPVQIGGGTIRGFETVLSITMTDYSDWITLSPYLHDLTVYGGGGDDTFIYYGFSTTAAIRTVAVGGDGNDTLLVNARQLDEEIYFLGGAGSDTVDFAPTRFSEGMIITLSDTEGNPVSVYSTIGVSQALNVRLVDVENIFGTGGSDIFRGNSLNNHIDGGGGADILYGMAGDDILTGGNSVDTLTGGGGSDTFFDTVAGLSGDTITDFQPEDRIIIRDATLNGFTFSLAGGSLAFTGGSVFLTGGFSGEFVASAAVGGGVQLSVRALVAIISDVRNDFNGDGRSDILWRNVDGTITDWLANGNGTFVSNHANAAYSLDPAFTVVGTGDFNGDGRDDLLLRHRNGTVTDWLGQPNGGFVSNHAVAVYALATNWTLAGTGDFNGDGRDDVLWRNEVGAMSQWLGQINGSFAYNPFAAYQLAPNWQLAAVGDFNGDGRDDVLWRNEVGAMSQWLGQGNGGYAYNPNAAYQLAANWTLAASGDFNGDGRDDILWRNEVGAMSQWLATANAGYAYNPNAAYQLPNNWELSTSGDFNGDGRDDLMWRNEVGAMAQWLANPDGTFTYNGNAAYELPVSWQMQPDQIV